MFFQSFELIKMFDLGKLNLYHHFQVDLVKNIIITIFFSFIIIVSLFGNSLVCYVILSNRRLRSKRTNLLIANLSISDLMMTTINIPLNLIGILINDWPFGLFMCKIIPQIHSVSVYVSTYSVASIAINRY